jgi:hypothetical protein
MNALLPVAIFTALVAAEPGAQSRTDQSAPELATMVDRLQELGLRITADQKQIDSATSEAAYFMFADRKEHRPDCKPLKLPEDGAWLAGKRVFDEGADREKIDPLFEKLVAAMEYDRVCVYDADVHYGVSSHARFTLYKFGYEKDDADREDRLEILLGDAEYVLNLP